MILILVPLTPIIAMGQRLKRIPVPSSGSSAFYIIVGIAGSTTIIVAKLAISVTWGLLTFVPAIIKMMDLVREIRSPYRHEGRPLPEQDIKQMFIFCISTGIIFFILWHAQTHGPMSLK